jgi:hypothetical protein
MPDIAIGGRHTLDADRAAIVTGRPTQFYVDLLAGHEPESNNEHNDKHKKSGKDTFPWRGGHFRVVEADPNSCVIERMASTTRGVETGAESAQSHDEMSVFDNPTPPAGGGVGHLHVKPVLRPSTPTDVINDPAPRGYPGTDPGREIVDDPAGGLAGPPSGFSVDVEKKRNYQAHPHLMRSPQDVAQKVGLPGGEPADQSLGYAGSDPRKMLARMFLIPSERPVTVRTPR